jgi:hypothetical protein
MTVCAVLDAGLLVGGEQFEHQRSNVLAQIGIRDLCRWAGEAGVSSFAMFRESPLLARSRNLFVL